MIGICCLILIFIGLVMTFDEAFFLGIAVIILSILIYMDEVQPHIIWVQ